MEKHVSKNRKAYNQTFTSFRHSCIAITSIIDHLIKDCDFTYVLTSFLQNDPLEHKFGLFKMMSGAQCHVSYCQFLERRIKLLGIMKLFSSDATTEQLFFYSFRTSILSNFTVHIFTAELFRCYCYYTHTSSTYIYCWIHSSFYSKK